MSIRVTCPECDYTFSVSDELKGKKIRCRECDGPILVREGRSKADEKMTEAPPKKKAAAPPAKKAVPVARRREDDDDDDEAPRRRKQPVKKGSSAGVLVAAVVGVVVLLVGVAIGLYFALSTNATNYPQAVVIPPPPGMLPPGMPDDFPPGGFPPEGMPGGFPPGGIPGGGVPGGNPPGGAPKDDEGKPGGGEVTTKPPEQPQDPAAGGGPVSGQTIYQYVLKSVAWIAARHGHGASFGTGSLIDRHNRLVLTNYHVIHGGSEFVVFFPLYRDGKLIASRDDYLKLMSASGGSNVIPGKVVAQDNTRDLALVQVDRVPDSIEPLVVARTSVSPGDGVHSVGNPGTSGGLWVYTSGTVRQVYKKKWKAMGPNLLLNLEAMAVETQSPTNPGDSGGPLVNNKGELVGVTQGGSMEGNLMSIFIDQSEVNDFIEKYFARTGGKWVRSNRPLLTPGTGTGPARGAQLPELIAKLRNADPSVRAQGVQGLGDMGSGARVALPDLIKALGDKDDLVQRLAKDALTKIGPPTKAEVPALVTALEDQHADVRRYALDALMKLGAEGQDALPALLRLADGSDAKARAEALRVVAKVGVKERSKVLEALEKGLKDADKSVRVAAAEALAADVQLSGGDTPRLQELLKHPDIEVRVQAARGLTRVGPAGKDAAPVLVATLTDADRALRQALLEALGAVGADAKVLMPELQRSLRDSDLEVRRAALKVVGRLGPAGKEAVPGVVKALDESELRKEAVAALAAVGPGAARDGATALSHHLLDKDVRKEVAAALAVIKPSGPEAQAVVARLIERFEEKEDREFRDKVIDALARIGKPAVPSLTTALRNSNPQVRLGACASLAQIGPDARTALPALLTLVNTDPVAEVQQEAAKAYRQLGGR